MQDKKFIYGMLALLGIILVTLVVVLFWPAGSEKVTVTEENPFGDTSAERPVVFDPNADPFADMDPGWINNSDGETSTRAPLLRMIHTGPVLQPTVYAAGSDNAKIPTVRFVERTNGHIFDTPLETVTGNTQVLDKTFQRLVDAQWGPSGSAFLFRYLDEENEVIFSYLANLAATPVSGSPLQNGVTSAVFSPDGSSLLYLADTGDGATAYLEPVGGGTRTQVWTPPLRGIAFSWDNQDTVVAYPKPAEEAAGVVWLLDTKDWSSRVVIAREHALSAKLSPDGSTLLYSFIEPNSRVWSLRAIVLASNEVTYLPMPTIVEKCAWGPGETRFIYCAIPRNLSNANWLMRWQQGRLASDDVLWRFDLKTGEAKMVLDPMNEAKVPFDITDLVVDPTSSFLVFRTKDRQILWAARLPATPAPSPAAF